MTDKLFKIVYIVLTENCVFELFFLGREDTRPKMLFEIFKASNQEKRITWGELF